MNIPKVSVITVVWNDAEGLERTIQSVINQTYENIEFIVIDGGSTDGTVDIIKKYKDQIDYWVSEKDHGIYDAMNKGIKVSTGMWINFMNAGDTFVNSKVVDNLKLSKYSNKSMLYGKKLQTGYIVNPLPINRLEVGELHANHQSMFFNKSLLGNEIVYYPEYKIYGDYELVNRLYMRDATSMLYVDQLIANYEAGGISDGVSLQKRKDRYKILYKHYGLIGVLRGILYRLTK